MYASGEPSNAYRTVDPAGVWMAAKPIESRDGPAVSGSSVWT